MKSCLTIVKISDDPLPTGFHRYYCPYCKSYMQAKAGTIVAHKCPDAGYTMICNGYLFVGLGEYLKNERESVHKPKGD